MLLRRRSPGFTLIEMLIVVAMVSILAAVAIPSYREYIKKSRRAEAQSYLLSLVARQQQFLVDTRAYATLATLTSSLPTPANVSTAYTVTMPDPAGTPPTFTVTATPKTDQSSEKCGTLTINETGTKTAAVSGCW
jgi:type IV pilus assembly protein PilE